MKIRVHPDMLAEIENMPPKDREQVMKILGFFQQAAENVGDNAGEEAFNAELERLSGAVTEKVDLDDVPDEVIERIRDGMPTEH